MRIALATLLATGIATAAIALGATPVLADDDDDRGKRYYSDNGRHHGHHHNRDWRDNRHHHQSRNHFSHRHHDGRGRNYWGPAGGQWSNWDYGWGNPHRFARQWGFDEYCDRRGWHRNGQWYANPSQWRDWGGWNWSFSVSNNGFNNNHSNFNHNYGNGGFDNCRTYRLEDWVNGRRAIVTYVGCTDRFGRVFEQQGSRRVERWVW